MYGKDDKEFSDYTDKNLVEELQTLTDQNSLQKFVKDHTGRIAQMTSAEEITNFILAASSLAINIGKDKFHANGWDKEKFVNQYCVKIFIKQFETIFKYQDLINLITRLCHNEDRSLKIVAAVSITNKMLHLIENDDQLHELSTIMEKHLGNEISELVDLVKGIWAKNDEFKISSPKTTNTYQFFSHSSENSFSECSDKEFSANDNLANSSAEESGYSLGH